MRPKHEHAMHEKLLLERLSSPFNVQDQHVFRFNMV